MLNEPSNSEIDQSMRPNSIFPLPQDEDKPMPLSPMKDEKEGLIKYPEIFQVSYDILLNVVETAQSRKFTEEIDKLEILGGLFFYINHSHIISKINNR